MHFTTNKTGFTLVELLISVAIFLIITAFVIINFRQGQWKDELRQGADIIATALREMQTKTNSGSQVICPGSTLLAEPVGGFGVRIDIGAATNQILLFADCSDATDQHIYDQTTDYLIFSNSISGHLQFDGITIVDVNNNETSTVILNAVFSSNTEMAWLNGKLADSTDGYAGAVVKLKHTLSDKTAEVRISSYTGQINVIMP